MSTKISCARVIGLLKAKRAKRVKTVKRALVVRRSLKNFFWERKNWNWILSGCFLQVVLWVALYLQRRRHNSYTIIDIGGPYSRGIITIIMMIRMTFTSKPLLLAPHSFPHDLQDHRSTPSFATLTTEVYMTNSRKLQTSKSTRDHLTFVERLPTRTCNT